jgi:hypothetical protein
VTQPYKWGMWVDWAADPELSLAEGADRLAASLRSVDHNLMPTNGGWATDAGQAHLPSDGPGFVDELAARLARSRTKATVAAPDGFADASLALLPQAGGGVRGSVRQGVTWAAEPVFLEGAFQLEFGRYDPFPLASLVDAAVRTLTEVAGVWHARNAWIDMVHVRQKWNHWEHGVPVFGWATWLDPAYATVDTAGLDVSTSTVDRRRLIVLRTDPDATGDSSRTVGRDTIWALSRRTTMADGTPLLDRNPSLRAAMRRS